MKASVTINGLSLERTHNDLFLWPGTPSLADDAFANGCFRAIGASSVASFPNLIKGK
jgi:hypothetical protein